MSIRCNAEEYRQYLIDNADTEEEEREYEEMSDGEICQMFWDGYEDQKYDEYRDSQLTDDD